VTITSIAPAEAQEAITASWARQLRQMAEFLEDNPGLPVSEFATITVPCFANSTAEVDEAAALLDAKARWTGDGSEYVVVAEIDGAPRIRYRASYMPPEVLRRINEQGSYFGSVQPDEPEVRRAA
jgi:hypothetical protein